MKPYKEFATVRLSHLLRHCSVGAVVRSSDFLVTVKDTSYWVNEKGEFAGRIIPYVEQVKKSLDIKEDLREPPIGSLDKDGNFEYGSGHYIQAQIFPSHFVCSRCRLLHFKPFYKTAQHNDPFWGESVGELKCTCGGSLDQLNLVQVDTRGYLSDVPFYRLAHQKQEFCDYKRTQLYFDVKTNEVRCSCGANGKLEFSQARYYQGFEQPWLDKKVDDSQQENNPTAHLMEVNDTRVHTPINVSALIIPPESRIHKGTPTDRLYRHEKREMLMTLRATGQDTSELERDLRRELGCDKASLKNAIKDIENGYPLFYNGLQEKELSELEYDALTTPLDFDENEDFVTEHFDDEFKNLIATTSEPLPKQIGTLIDKVVAVKKLKEILIFKGFTRGGETHSDNENKPKETDDNDDDDDETDHIIPPDLGKGVGFLPALELYGEGIFIRFDDELLRQWENHPQVVARTDILAERFGSSHLAKYLQKTLVLTPRFLLLHAFSHLLIKELESLAGYPAASLKEKIYSSPSTDNPMAGILIYTVAPDVDGTLGGLVELSEPRRLLKVLVRVLTRMQWCSLDPVCGSHTGQGPSLLNLAACHSCLLLPETSCMCGNVLLDRVLLKGDKITALPSVFDFVK